MPPADAAALAELPIIVSPASGARAGRAVEPLLRDLISPFFTPRFLYPATPDELARAVRDIVTARARRVAVAGGDGTIHRAVNAIADAPLVVGPIPIGSGNDFCRGVELTTDPATAVAALADGRTRRVDLIEINGTRVCTVAGLGFVADTGVQIAQVLAPGSVWRPLGRALGGSIYLLAAALRLAHPTIAAAARVAWRDRSGQWHEDQRRLHGILLANLPTLGAGLRLPVPGDPEDGAFELVQVIEGPRLRLARCLSCLRSDRPVPPGAIHVAQATEAVIEWEGGSRLLGDGEDLGASSRFHVRALPAALEVPRPREG